MGGEDNYLDQPVASSYLSRTTKPCIPYHLVRNPSRVVNLKEFLRNAGGLTTELYLARVS